jgi:hypothetical protein
MDRSGKLGGLIQDHLYQLHRLSLDGREATGATEQSYALGHLNQLVWETAIRGTRNTRPGEVTDRLFGAAGDDLEDLSGRPCTSMLDQVNEGAGYVISRDLAQAQSSLEPCLPHPCRIDVYARAARAPFHPTHRTVRRHSVIAT